MYSRAIIHFSIFQLYLYWLLLIVIATYIIFYLFYNNNTKSFGLVGIRKYNYLEYF